MRSAIIMKASQGEQQKQTTNINYIQNFVHMKKDLINKSK